MSHTPPQQPPCKSPSISPWAPVAPVAPRLPRSCRGLSPARLVHPPHSPFPASGRAERRLRDWTNQLLAQLFGRKGGLKPAKPVGHTSIFLRGWEGVERTFLKGLGLETLSQTTGFGSGRPRSPPAGETAQRAAARSGTMDTFRARPESLHVGAAGQRGCSHGDPSSDPRAQPRCCSCGRGCPMANPTHLSPQVRRVNRAVGMARKRPRLAPLAP